MNVNFYVATDGNGFVKNSTEVAEEATVDSVKVWIVRGEKKGQPAQLEGCTPWVKVGFGWVAVEFVEGATL